jgi:repressor LexA
MMPLKPREQEALNAIAAAIRRGRSPRTCELVEVLRLAHVSGLTYLLKNLESAGMICIEGGVRGRQRLIELTDQGKAAARIGVPVLGRIAAGPMVLAVNEASEWVEPGQMLKVQPGDFFLPVDGDSMIEDGILPGDRVLIRPNIQVGNGEIAAVAQEELGSGDYLATLKRVYHEPGHKTVRLKASNAKYEDLVVPASQLRIVGAYRGLLRTLD